MFRRVERKLKKMSSIYSKEEYFSANRIFGTVRDLGKECVIKGTKSLWRLYKTLENIKNVKRIRITKKCNGKRCTVGGQLYHRFEDVKASGTLLKKGVITSELRIRRTSIRAIDIGSLIKKNYLAVPVESFQNSRNEFGTENLLMSLF